MLYLHTYFRNHLVPGPSVSRSRQAAETAGRPGGHCEARMLEYRRGIDAASLGII